MDSVLNGTCSVPEAAERYAIGTATLERWLRRQRETGQCAARPRGGGPARKLAAAGDTIRAAVQAQPDITLAELCERVQQTLGVKASISMMWREVARLGLTFKKSRSTPVSATRRRSSSNGPPSARVSWSGT